MKNKNIFRKSSVLFLLSTILVSTLMPKANAALLTDGFESGTFGVWNTIGDTSIQQGGPSNNNGDANDFNEIAPFAGVYHALITTACVDTSLISGGFCGNSPAGRSGQDDGENPAGRFEFSDTGVVNATAASGLGNDAYALQTFLGLSNTALEQAGSDAGVGNRTIKEGSAIRRNFTVDGTVSVAFRWAFLTNDFDEIEAGVNVDGYGGRDFGFYTLYNTSSTVGSRGINVLRESDFDTYDVAFDFPADVFPDDPNTVNFRYKINYQNLNLGILPAGTYTIGFGVVDGAGNEYTSALLIDNFDVGPEVPEGSSLLGLLGLGLGLCFLPKKKKIRL